jgi:hypothetical protein
MVDFWLCARNRSQIQHCSHASSRALWLIFGYARATARRFNIADKVKNFAAIYLVDITKVPDFNKMYELYDPVTVMFFYRNKHMMIDLGTLI